ncbi:MAG TPA: hypothetical protein EYM39_03795 [Candidatus Latescibacteria bacterium]|nr:hypothetical protein [Candidatus Latescibacterota bacterium]
MGIRLCGVGRYRWRRHACQLWCCAAAAWGFSCAKVGAPSGGEVDRDPPVVMGHTPATDATDVPLYEPVVIEFSEGMERGRTREAVFIAPRSEVEYHWRGRKLELTFDGGLKADQTYVITVGTDARDRRRNALDQSFTFAFATGSQLNPGRIEGRVFQDNAAASGARVWAYDMSGFTGVVGAELPDYETQSGRDGSYAFQRLSQGSYRILAFTDRNRNGRHDPGEFLALPSSDVTVQADRAEERAGDLILTERGAAAPQLERVQVLDDRRLLLIFDRNIDLSSLQLSLKGLGVVGRYAAPKDGRRVYVLTQRQESGKQYSIASLEVEGHSIAWDNPLRGSSRTDQKQPSLEAQEPPDGGTTTGDSLTLLFSEAMDTTAVTGILWVETDSTQAPAGSWQWAGLLDLVFKPTVPLAPGTYRLRARLEGLQDRAGVALAGSTAGFEFAVLSESDLAAIKGTVRKFDQEQQPALIWIVAQGSKAGRTYRAATDSTGAYYLGGLIPGNLAVSAFEDRNGNGDFDGGSLDPFVPAEAQAVREGPVATTPGAVVADIDFELR